jgi:hypothetical protein
MAIVGVISGVILLCLIAGLWISGSMTTRKFNLRGRNTVEPHEPRPRTPGLD